MNTWPTGAPSGQWVNVGSVGAASAGQRITRTVGGSLGDGLHAWRVTARDAAGNESVTRRVIVRR